MALELEQITKTVGREVHIHPTDLRLEPGHFNTLLGTTLAGKTTLMQLMAGLERPSAGRIRFAGQDVTGVPVRRRNVSMVYQQFINYPNMTVFENIASPLRVARMSEDEIRARVGRMAEILHISAWLDRRPAELSGGQQQRTAMARALVKDSGLVLLDEPLANLDFKLREELRDELPRLFAERDAVVVYATTEPTEALLLGGMTATMHEGRVTHFGPSGEVYRRPRDLVTAQVFSDPPLNIAEVRKEGREIFLDAVRWPAPAGLADGRYVVGIRPHHVTPAPDDRPRVALEGRVQVAEISGSESTIHFTIGGRNWVSVSHGVHPYEAGERTMFHADVARALYFAPEDGRLVAVGNEKPGG
ncbi:MAG: ABC transporter ATP-binding protein [Alphaproteobacteria bacterium]|nr:MAG: ABC transporter ATP-binding protein [Alphaproteobacteria bacterium]